MATALGVSRQTVALWRQRFAVHRLEGLVDAPRSGAPRRISDEAVERLVALTLEEAPRNATHWSTRAMAHRSGMSQTAVPRILQLGRAERATADDRRHGTLDLFAALDVTADTVIGCCAASSQRRVPRVP